MIWVAVALAGGAGATARFLVDHFVAARLQSRTPWGTWVVNVSGSLLAGVVAGAVGSHASASALSMIVAGGFLGAYTTFSTAMLQAARQLEERTVPSGMVNLVGTLLTCLPAAAIGVAIGA